MVRYKLDELGWYQFEWLVQSLLKAELGLGIESWGARADHGRDAYFKGPLSFPAKHLSSDGPFFFQVKFVEAANAAGAKSDGPLIDAVRKEAAQIKTRRSFKKWKAPKHYAVLTNAPLRPPVRDRIRKLIEGSIPKVRVHSFGGNDISDLLDKHPDLRRSFPQLLSLRDLDELILEAVNKETLERSRSAVDCARDIVPVFAPTAAYTKAWNILRKHHFVVLEGPPEMGKTAIAWMIALAQLSQGWQAIVCDEPEDFFQLYKTGYSQVFVADDAFGRTEYDPIRGIKWERQLNRIYRQLDQKHWLLWTSRKHILERARRLMDLQGEASNFPNPAAILVDASELSLKEKALILYRHSRGANLGDTSKILIREHARGVVQNLNFTPERIRRFIKEALPDLSGQLKRGSFNEEKLSAEIREAIRNPTDRMRKSFRFLPPSHKWMLISLLEAGEYADVDDVGKEYESHCPREFRRPFEEVLDELRESFI